MSGAPKPGSAEHPVPRTSLPLAMLGFLVIALLLRAAAAMNDFWLDEIWSLRMAQRLQSPLGVLTELHHDNNHPLNTLFLYFLGDQALWWVYRLPAVLAGAATVGLAGRVGARAGTAAAVAAMGLTALSFLLIQYSSEARGYGFAVFCTLLSLLLAYRYVEQSSPARALLLAGSILLGFLSHLTFIHVYLGLLAWTTLRRVRERSSWPDTLRSLALVHLPVWLGLAALYWVDLRHLTIGGRNEYSIPGVAATTAAYTLGLPVAGFGPWVALVLAAGLCMAGLTALRRQGADEWIFYLVAIVISPALLLALRQPDALFERYFLVCATCLLILLASLLGRALAGGRAIRAMALCLAAAWTTGNLIHLNTLTTYGRGSYREAVQYLASQTAGERVSVASDHDFRNRMLLDYYWPYAPAGKTQVYFDQEQYPPEGVEWTLVHRLEGETAPPEIWTDAAGRRFRLARAFPHRGLSGWSWYLYRRE